MNIIFLSYWGIDDDLTVSTVFPHLRLLQQMPQVHKIMLITVDATQQVANSYVLTPTSLRIK